MTRILLVEDNPGDAVIFRETLDASKLEYDLVHAKRLGEGLEQIGETAFDILMVDLSLPDAQGMETVRQVREAAPDLPLIVLTGLDDAASAAEAKSLGAVDYLVKWYVDSTSLARYIRYAIAQYEMYGGGGKDQTSADASAAPVVEGETARPPSDGADAAEPSQEDPSAEPLPEKASLESVPTPKVEEGDLLRHAAEAALAFAEHSERRSAWMADVLRSALDLHRVTTGEVEVRSETVDVLDLARQMVTEQRGLAMRCGIPLHTTSDHKKVMAQADRNLVIHTLRRLVVDALQSADASGVEVRVEVKEGGALVETSWTESRASIDAAADCIALGRSVVEQTIRLTGGESTHQGDANGRYRFSLRLPAVA